MNFFHLGDLHIGRYLKGISLLEDQKEILNDISLKARELRPDFIVLSGDIFDRSIPREDAMKVYEDFIYKIVMEEKIPVYAISGNHDSALRLSGMNNLLKKSGYHVEGVLKAPITTETMTKGDERLTLVFLPYKDRDGLRGHYKKYYLGEDEKFDTKMTDGDIYENILKDTANLPGNKVLIAHNFFTIKNVIPEKSDTERNLSIGGEDQITLPALEKFSYVALGHLHKAQKVGKDTIRYAGSIMKYSLSEVNYKITFPHVSIDKDGKTTMELIKINSPKDMVILKGTFNEVTHGNFYEKKDNYIKVELLDKERIDNAFQILQMLYPNIIGIEYVNLEDKEEAEYNIESMEKLNVYELFEEFFNARLGREMDEDERKIVNEVLKEELE